MNYPDKNREEFASKIYDRAEDLLGGEDVDANACRSLALELLDPYELRVANYPIKIGWYWFYGDPFCLESETWKWNPFLHMVRVDFAGRWYYTTEGFAFKNSMPGLWAEVLTPDAEPKMMIQKLKEQEKRNAKTK